MNWEPIYTWFELRDRRRQVPKRDKRRKGHPWLDDALLKRGETWARLPRTAHCVRLAADQGTTGARTLCGHYGSYPPVPARTARERKRQEQPYVGLYKPRASTPDCPRCQAIQRDWLRHGGAPVETELREMSLPRPCQGIAQPVELSWSRLCLLSAQSFRMLNGVSVTLGYTSLWQVPLELYSDVVSYGIEAAEALRL